MAILAGFLRPDAGRVDILGKGAFDPAIHAGRVGVLPQDAELPPASTPRQLLEIWARLGGLRGQDASAAASRALDDVQLADRAGARVRTLSHGMRRRLAVASAMLGSPELVLLDEPTSGLDPAQARLLRSHLVAGRGRRTVLVSSHHLAELEEVCDHVVFIEAGRCTREGPMSSITGRDREVRIHLAQPFPPGRGEVVRVCLPPEDPRSMEEATTQALAELIAEGARISEVRRGDSLERAFLGE
jgi:ABC-type multidrug transport system ATPase subunit